MVDLEYQEYQEHQESANGLQLHLLEGPRRIELVSAAAGAGVTVR